MILPFTYIMIILWILLTLSFENEYLRLIPPLFGAYVGLATLANGEKWLKIASDNTLTIVSFDTGFGSTVGLFVTFISIAELLIIGVNLYEIRKERSRNR